ncbi:MAG TPA: MotA/TolQ/ExbB proton channel family protein, partial [Acidimicrobiia bacterium]|nr:MotA/TolQ/ExbB proton channel family protein [Acidimicrobiia bacterium]
MPKTIGALAAAAVGIPGGAAGVGEPPGPDAAPEAAVAAVLEELAPVARGALPAAVADFGVARPAGVEASAADAPCAAGDVPPPALLSAGAPPAPVPP